MESVGALLVRLASPCCVCVCACECVCLWCAERWRVCIVFPFWIHDGRDFFLSGVLFSYLRAGVVRSCAGVDVMYLII